MRCAAPVLVCLLLLAAPAGGSEPEATQPLESDDGKYRLHVPADWDAAARDEEDTDLAYACTVPGVDGPVTISLQDVVDVLLSPRAQALFDRPRKRKAYGTDDVELREKPLAHLVVRGEREGAKYVWVCPYLRRKGHGIHLRLGVPAAAHDALAPALFEIAASVEAAVEPWPPALPDEYASKTVRGLRIAWSPDLKGQDGLAAQRYVSKVVKEFERFHGRIERPKDEPLTVLVHASLKTVEAACPEAAKLRHTAGADLLRRRVHTIPLDGEFRMVWAPPLRRALTRVLLHERYRVWLPSWLRIGELEWAFYRERADTKKPVYPLARGKKLKEQPLTPLDELEAYAEVDWGAHAEQAHLYVLLFRRGPSKYKSAYKKFLLALEKSGDWEAAAEKHLFSLGCQKLRIAAWEFLEKKTESVFD